MTSLHHDGTATVELDGIRQRVSTALLEAVAVDDYVIVHVGYALTRLDEDEARHTLALLARGAAQ